MSEQRLSQMDPNFSVETYRDVLDALTGIYYRNWGAQPAKTGIIDMIHSIIRATAPVAGGRIYHDSADAANQFSVTETRYLYKGELKTVAASNANALSGGDVAHYISIAAATGALTISTTGWPTTPHVRLGVITLSGGAWSWDDYAEHRHGMVLNVVAEPVGGRRDVEAKTSGYTITAADCGKRITNTGTSALVELTLPAAESGLWYEFAVTDTDGLKVIAAGSDTIRDGGTVSAGGGSISSSTIGACLRLECVTAGQWFVTSKNGTWGSLT